MKKTYYTIATVFIILIAAILTSISNTENEIVDTPIPTTSNNTQQVEKISTSTATTSVKNNNQVKQDSIASSIKLNSKNWTWMQTTYPKGTVFVPKNSEKFVLTFEQNGFSSRTDCNGVGGEYIINGKSIKFDKMMSTLMYCEGSQESIYTEMLSQAISYDISDNKELLLNLKDGSTMLFK